jgi:hypothetical protein
MISEKFRVANSFFIRNGDDVWKQATQQKSSKKKPNQLERKHPSVSVQVEASHVPQPEHEAV